MRDRILKIQELAQKQQAKISTFPLIREASIRRIEDKSRIKKDAIHDTTTELINNHREQM